MILIVLLAISLRLLAISVIGHPEILQGKFVLKNDESSYHLPAVALATTGQYSRAPGGAPTAYRPPGIIVPLAILYWLITPSPYVALGYVLVCSLAIIFAARALAWATVQDRRVADLSTLVAACLPTLLWTSSGIWSDAPALLFTLLTLFFLIEPFRAHRLLKWLLVGGCASLAYLNRPSAVFLLPFLAGAVALSDVGLRRARNVLVFALALAIPIGVWGARNWRTFGKFFTGATVAGHTLWESNNPVTAGLVLPAVRSVNGFNLDEEARTGQFLGSWVPAQYIPGTATVAVRKLPEMAAYSAYVHLTAIFLWRNPLAAVRLLGFKLVRIFTADPVAPSISGDVGATRLLKRSVTFLERWFFIIFGTMGMLQLYRTRSSTRHAYTAFAAAGLLTVLVGYVNARLLLPVTGVLIVPASMGVSLLWERVTVRLPCSPAF